MKYDQEDYSISIVETMLEVEFDWLIKTENFLSWKCSTYRWVWCHSQRIVHTFLLNRWPRVELVLIVSISQHFSLFDLKTKKMKWKLNDIKINFLLSIWSRSQGALSRVLTRSNWRKTKVGNVRPAVQWSNGHTIELIDPTTNEHSTEYSRRSRSLLLSTSLTMD